MLLFAIANWHCTVVEGGVKSDFELLAFLCRIKSKKKHCILNFLIFEDFIQNFLSYLQVDIHKLARMD